MNGSWDNVAETISLNTAKNITFKNKTSVSGGCINQCWKVTDTKHQIWFIKTNSPSLANMFIAEANGLNEILQTTSIRTPTPICHGITNDFSFLALEYIHLGPLTNQALAGEKLAKMHYHSIRKSNHFGWKQNNTIGSTPQSNKYHNDWISFWRHERLLFQLKRALKKGYPHKSYDLGLKLSEKLPLFFSNYQVQASLLHGDLWGGNCASDENGNPVIFDPAVYYGDRETDLAMTELFGGFSQEFYRAYNERYPLDSGYTVRKKLYNLYHILNHFNLFSGGYASQAHTMTEHLLSEV